MMKTFTLLKALAPALEASSTKIHLAGYNGFDNPLEVFLDGQFEEWQRIQNRKNFERPFVLSLIAMDQPHSWLFGGIHRSGTPKPYEPNGWLYPLEEVEEAKPLNGRLVVNFQRPGRQSYLNAERWVDTLIVKEVLQERLQFARFPGFKSVLLSANDLKKVVRDQLPDWKAALSSVAGIYLISDKESGKLYVGSATGEGGIWQRWCNYADTGHGNNVELRAVLQELGVSHGENFQYSVLEIADTHTSQNEILHRESHWKNALLCRLHGYNKN